MATDSIGGLPTRPLTEAHLRSLASHPDIGICYLIYQLADDPDAIISIYLGSNDQIHLLLYNPDEERWERLETIDEPESLTEAVGLNTEATQEQFETYYDEGEIEPAGYLTDPMDAFAANFPPEPLTDDQLTAISDRGYVVSAVPFVRRQCDDHSIAVLLVFDDPIEATRIVGSFGYDQTGGAWQLLSTAAPTGADDETALEPLAEDTTEWIFEEYAQDEIRLADEAETTATSDNEE